MTLPLPPELPILPTPRERAFLVLMNPDATVESFGAVVEGDPSLTAAVLRAANSAMSFPARPVRGATEGVVRLGTSAVRHLITATLVRSEFASVEAAGIDAEELWRHLLGCALLCEAQAKPKRDDNLRQTAFTAGLLHDLGRLAMAAQAPTRYRQVVDAAQEGMGTHEAERFLFGVDHAEFGQRICERWRLAEDVCAAVGDHHDCLDDERFTRVGGPRDVNVFLARAREVMTGLGIGDGVLRPEAPDPAYDQHPLVLAVGGKAELTNSIRWFRDSTTARAERSA
ncbi:MAG: HDOD domain-containing protein [Dehalococcoidia bacterium]